MDNKPFDFSTFFTADVNSEAMQRAGKTLADMYLGFTSELLANGITQADANAAFMLTMAGMSFGKGQQPPTEGGK